MSKSKDKTSKKKHIDPTLEQLEVISSKDRIKVVEAYAGSGKSSLLRWEAQAHPDERILYLVYGRRAKDDAEAIFTGVDNVKVRTVHSHAFVQEGCRWKASLYAGNALSFLSSYKTRNKHELSVISSEFMTYYLNSSVIQVKSALNNYIDLLGRSDKTRLIERYYDDIIKICTKQLDSWLSKKNDCPHDFYLKHSYNSGSFSQGLSRYDRVLVDEAQDLSPVMAESIKTYTSNLVIVGDSYQSIYGFRYAINALEMFSNASHYTLSQSFRFGENIAHFVTDYMQAIFTRDFHMTGASCYKGDVWYSIPKQRRQSVYLSRTNLELVTKAIWCLDHNKSFLFDKDVTYLLDKLEDVWHIYKNRRSLVKDIFYKTFKTYDQLRSHAMLVEDVILLSLISVVDRYKNLIGDILYDLRDSLENPSGDVLLSTVHASKGKEYDSIHLAPDLFKALDRAVKRRKKASDNVSDEEFRIFYVALTRGKKSLILPNKMREQLAGGWIGWIEDQYEPSDIRFWVS